VWTAIEPDLSSLQPLIAQADRRFASSNANVQGLLIAAIADRYARRPPPATFRLIVSPMVTWVWIGALIVFGGALIAMWPASLPAPARRRAPAAGYGQRVARGLGRA
jgi:cytochrome c-type biogenesis protein CcmF